MHTGALLQWHTLRLFAVVCWGHLDMYLIAYLSLTHYLLLFLVTCDIIFPTAVYRPTGGDRCSLVSCETLGHHRAVLLGGMGPPEE